MNYQLGTEIFLLFFFYFCNPNLFANQSSFFNNEYQLFVSIHSEEHAGILIENKIGECQSGRPDSYRESKLESLNENKIGDLSEWSNEQAWKVCIRVTVSRVRIPQSPPKAQVHHF